MYGAERLRRRGRSHNEHVIVLLLIMVVSTVVVHWLGRDKPDPRPIRERLVATAVGLLQCFGVFVGASVLLASVEMAKQAAWRYRRKRTETKLSHLRPLLADSTGKGCPDNLRRVLRLLEDKDAVVRGQALAAAYTLLRGAGPALVAQAGAARVGLERALLSEPGFPRVLSDTPAGFPLSSLVTLGAKLGAGTAEKRLAPVTCHPGALAGWIHQQRDPDEVHEVQVSVGYDTGSWPYLGERGKFIALFLYIASTDLKRFQALLRRPPRDPNAAYGLLIRGDVVEPHYAGQARGHRLDYVFPLPELSEANLTEFIRVLQLLNLGLLTASAEDSARALLPGAAPAWLDARRRGVARAYRLFERQLVALLRRHDRYRDPEKIHPLQPGDHAERTRAFQLFRLEECLYPHYRWIVPLYDADTRWERLLVPLRGVEAMMLHQGEVQGSDVTRGLDFIHQTRLVGHQAATQISDLLKAEEVSEPGPPVPPDPFIDAADEEATACYLRRVSQDLACGEASVEELPDPATFRLATAYYEAEWAQTTV
jgi:hypothetical protein